MVNQSDETVIVKSHPDSSTPVPRTIGTFEDTVPSEYASMTLDGNNLYINDYNYGLRIFDIRDPARPILLGGVPTAAEGRWLYVLIFDVRDSSVIRPAGVLFEAERAGWQYFSCEVLVNGTRLYPGDYEGPGRHQDLFNR